MSIDYLDVSKHLDSLDEQYVLGSGGLLSEGGQLDYVLHKYAQARQEAKGMGVSADYPNLVPCVLSFEDDTREGGVTTTNRVLPALSTNGEALFQAQVGKQMAFGGTYCVVLPANDLKKLEDASGWTVKYDPASLSEAFLDANFLDQQVWSSDANPIYREMFFRVLNQSPELGEGEELKWRGEPSVNEFVDSGVHRDYYGNLLRKIAGVDIEEDRDTVIARNAKDAIAALPRDEKLAIIADHDVPFEGMPQFAQESELTEAIYDELGDVRDLDEWSTYEKPEMVMEDEA